MYNDGLITNKTSRNFLIKRDYYNRIKVIQSKGIDSEGNKSYNGVIVDLSIKYDVSERTIRYLIYSK